MGIVFDCVGCGNPMQAPENLAGRQARCPTCQTVQVVPEQVYEAEEVVPSSSLPRPDGERRGDDSEAAEQDRRPCPMCGEMILTHARKCRFCGEILDAGLRRRSGSGGRRGSVRTLMSGLGGLWIFFGCGSLLVAVDGIAVSEGRRGSGGDEALVALVVLVSLAWLVFGICTCQKQLWAVCAGLVFSYLALVLNLIGMAAIVTADREESGAAGLFFLLLLLVPGIVQAHRVISRLGPTSGRWSSTDPQS